MTVDPLAWAALAFLGTILVATAGLGIFVALQLKKRRGEK